MYLSKKMGIYLVFLSFTLGVIAPVKGWGQVQKSCPGGALLKLSAVSVSQGSLVLVQARVPQQTSEVQAEWDGQVAPLWREAERSGTWHGLLGVDLEKPPGRYEWTVTWRGAEGAETGCSVFLTVRAGRFATEHLQVGKKFVEPDPEQLKRAQADQEKMRAIYAAVTPERFWEGPFRLPLKEAAPGGNFGRRRVLNGEARSPHSGVDFPAAEGTPVYAAQRGKVVLAEELYYSGNTVVIDHGYGIYTLYAHLSELEVRPGQPVKPSEEIGKVGATGRVTGPHLHWGLTVEHARVNALDIVSRQP